MATDSKSQDSVMQVRLDPKTKYFAILLSKHAGLTLSEFVSNCVEAVLEESTVTVAERDLTYAQLQKQLWAEHAADRFALLVSNFPAEMTVRERLLWTGIVRQSQEFWSVPIAQLYRTKRSIDSLNLKRLRTRWEEFECMNRDEIASLAQKLKAANDNSAESSMTPEQKDFRDSIRAQFAAKKAAAKKGK